VIKAHELRRFAPISDRPLHPGAVDTAGADIGYGQPVDGGRRPSLDSEHRAPSTASPQPIWTTLRVAHSALDNRERHDGLIGASGPRLPTAPTAIPVTLSMTSLCSPGSERNGPDQTRHIARSLTVEYNPPQPASLRSDHDPRSD
jgi:hypothetical protein